MNKKTKKLIQGQKARRIQRVRAKVTGTAKRPRLAVYRSLRYLSGQVINDETGNTVASVHQRELKGKGKPVELAAKLGSLLAEKAKKAGVEEVVFDRRSYKYHGKVKAFAEGAREGGLKF